MIGASVCPDTVQVVSSWKCTKSILSSAKQTIKLYADRGTLALITGMSAAYTSTAYDNYSDGKAGLNDRGHGVLLYVDRVPCVEVMPSTPEADSYSKSTKNAQTCLTWLRVLLTLSMLVANIWIPRNQNKYHTYSDSSWKRASIQIPTYEGKKQFFFDFYIFSF